MNTFIRHMEQSGLLRHWKVLFLGPVQISLEDVCFEKGERQVQNCSHVPGVEATGAAGGGQGQGCGLCRLCNRPPGSPVVGRTDCEDVL